MMSNVFSVSTTLNTTELAMSYSLLVTVTYSRIMNSNMKDTCEYSHSIVERCVYSNREA